MWLSGFNEEIGKQFVLRVEIFFLLLLLVKNNRKLLAFRTVQCVTCVGYGIAVMLRQELSHLLSFPLSCSLYVSSELNNQKYVTHFKMWLEIVEIAFPLEK